MEASFRRYIEQCPDAVMATNRDARVQYVNSAYERLTGYARSELVGRTPALLKSGRHEADFYRGLWATLLAGADFRAVFCNRRKDGALFYEDKIIRPVEGGYISFGRDVTERSREVEKLAHAATHDALTDLPSRGLFGDRLGQALRHAARRGEELAVAIMDIDRFRDTNNRHGHLAGDAVLRAVAGRSVRCVRESDTVARIGGDELALLLVNPGDQTALERILRQIVEANAVPVPYDGRALPVSVSLGVSIYPGDAASEVELHRSADAKMYQAKRAGGNRYVL